MDFLWISLAFLLEVFQLEKTVDVPMDFLLDFLTVHKVLKDILKISYGFPLDGIDFLRTFSGLFPCIPKVFRCCS